MSMAADHRCEGTTWKASPAWTYSMIRSTMPSNWARSMFETNSGASRSAARAAAVASGAGTGPASRARTSPMVSTAAA